MGHRIGSAFTVVSFLLFPLVANAQVPSAAAYPGPSRPEGYRATPAVYRAAQGASYGNAQPASYAVGQVPAYAAASYGASYGTRSYATTSYGGAPYGYVGYPGYGNPSYGSPYPVAGNAAWNPSNGGAYAATSEAPSPLVKTKDRLHYVEFGMGTFLPTDQGNTAKFGVEANVWAIHGGWVPNSGMYLTLDASTGFDIGCLGKNPNDGCKGHLRVHWIGAGPFFNTGKPMIASDVPRSWDMMALTGAEVRVWKGMTFKTTVNWFLPNPWGVYAHEKSIAEAQVNGAVSAASNAGWTPEANAAAAQQIAAINPADEMEKILGHALTHPQFNLMAMWEF